MPATQHTAVMQKLTEIAQNCGKDPTWVELEGHSRSSNLSPVGRAHATSYYWLTVTVSITASGFFNIYLQI